MFLLERILIRGQAGVGKTTLCKRIVYGFLYEDIWAGLFDRLLWVPLRTLRGRSTPGYSMAKWLGDEYFHDLPDKDIFAEALTQAINDTIQYSKTLFILDGLDEVSRDMDSESSKLFHRLLKQPHAIITSQPSGGSLAHISPVDLELETIGFYPEQVKEYQESCTQSSRRDSVVSRYSASISAVSPDSHSTRRSLF